MSYLKFLNNVRVAIKAYHHENIDNLDQSDEAYERLDATQVNLVDLVGNDYFHGLSNGLGLLEVSDDIKIDFEQLLSGGSISVYATVNEERSFIGFIEKLWD